MWWTFVLDMHGEEFSRVTYGDVELLKEAIKIFRHITKDENGNQYYLNQ